MKNTDSNTEKKVRVKCDHGMEYCQKISSITFKGFFNTWKNTEKKAWVKCDRDVGEGQTTNNLVLPNIFQVLHSKGF